MFFIRPMQLRLTRYMPFRLPLYNWMLRLKDDFMLGPVDFCKKWPLYAKQDISVDDGFIWWVTIILFYSICRVVYDHFFNSTALK